MALLGAWLLAAAVLLSANNLTQWTDAKEDDTEDANATDDKAAENEEAEMTHHRWVEIVDEANSAINRAADLAKDLNDAPDERPQRI